MKIVKALMVSLIRQQLLEHPFPGLCDHDLEHDILTEDLHLSHLASRIISRCLTLRLLTYGKQHTKDVIHGEKLDFVCKQQNLYFSRECNINLVAFAANKSLSAALNCTQCLTLIDAKNQYIT